MCRSECHHYDGGRYHYLHYAAPDGQLNRCWNSVNSKVINHLCPASSSYMYQIIHNKILETLIKNVTSYQSVAASGPSSIRLHKPVRKVIPEVELEPDSLEAEAERTRDRISATDNPSHPVCGELLQMDS